MKIENLDAKMEVTTFEFEDKPEGDGSTLHERRIEVNDVDKNGIKFMCHDEDNNPCHVVFSAADARHLAAELLEAADDLDRISAHTNEDLSETDKQSIEDLLAVLTPASECPHPVRAGRHEEYMRSDGSTFCRACGAELTPEQRTP